MNALQVSVIDSFEGWEKLAPEWNATLEQSSSGSVFLTWEWLSSWAECCLGKTRSLFILVMHEKGSLAGLAPFYIEQVKNGPFTLREVRFLGSPEAGSDYLDVIARRGREKEVAEAVYEFLTGEGGAAWDVLNLQEIPADALFLVHFGRRIQIEGKHSEMVRSSYCPVVSLPPTGDDYLSMLSPWRRKKFKQDLRVSRRDWQVVHSVDTGDEAAGCLDEFFSLYEEKGGWSGETLKAVLQRFIDRGNGSACIQLDRLSFDGQLIAALLHLKYGNVLSMYLMAVDKGFNSRLSVGNLIVGSCILNSISAGYHLYDFLRGEEGYKFHWANGGRSGMQLLFWQKRPAAIATGIGRLARHAGKLLIR